MSTTFEVVQKRLETGGLNEGIAWSDLAKMKSKANFRR